VLDTRVAGTACKDGQCVDTKKKTCTNGKTTVDHGWFGAGDGDNACNKCSCTDGSLGCTEMVCNAKQSCEHDGQTVAHGWSGKGSGDSFCNKCSCNAGEMACTKMLCDKCAITKCGEGKPRAVCLSVYTTTRCITPLRPLLTCG